MPGFTLLSFVVCLAYPHEFNVDVRPYNYELCADHSAEIAHHHLHSSADFSCAIPSSPFGNQADDDDDSPNWKDFGADNGWYSLEPSPLPPFGQRATPPVESAKGVQENGWVTKHPPQAQYGVSSSSGPVQVKPALLLLKRACPLLKCAWPVLKPRLAGA
jgi:hypothetical protein